MLKLLASEHRLTILCRLFEGEASVSDLAYCLGQSIAGTSQHLAKMRAENLLTTRRDGQTIYYSICDPAAKEVVETLCQIYK
ncbi:ArsR/SmtB family transcription factor [Asticcacaulis sp.]